MHNFKELKVWKLSIELSKAIFQTTRYFPNEYKYSLTTQMLRSSISIPSNISEGCGRKSNKELKQFLSISLGSSYELETQLIIAKEVDFITNEQFKELSLKISEIQKMLSGFAKSLDT